MYDKSGNRKYLTPDERQVYLQALMHESNEGRRAFCLTLLFTGCRISEALNLTAGRVDLPGKAIIFETLKQRRRGRYRSIPIPDSLVKQLREMVVGLEIPAYLWTFSRATAYRLVTGYMVHAGIIGGMACPKGLRHGFAVACIAQKVPLPIVQKWLGHARMETTAIYLEVSGTEERELAERIWSE